MQSIQTGWLLCPHIHRSMLHQSDEKYPSSHISAYRRSPAQVSQHWSIRRFSFLTSALFDHHLCLLVLEMYAIALTFSLHSTNLSHSSSESSCMVSPAGFSAIPSHGSTMCQTSTSCKRRAAMVAQTKPLVSHEVHTVTLAKMAYTQTSLSLEGDTFKSLISTESCGTSCIDDIR